MSDDLETLVELYDLAAEWQSMLLTGKYLGNSYSSRVSSKSIFVELPLNTKGSWTANPLAAFCEPLQIKFLKWRCSPKVVSYITTKAGV
jgi:hypothetical protein